MIQSLRKDVVEADRNIAHEGLARALRPAAAKGDRFRRLAPVEVAGIGLCHILLPHHNRPGPRWPVYDDLLRPFWQWSGQGDL